jgi:cobyrinic acid a,c-diamide synthase
MYDGESSAAALAWILGLPLILVVDAYGMAESAGAVVKGFSEYGLKISDRCVTNIQPETVSRLQSAIAGVIFNRVSSESHYERLKQSVEGVPVFGYLPRSADFGIPHRHLGLTVAEENPIVAENLEKLAETVLEHIDMEAISAEARRSGSTEERKPGGPEEGISSRVRIAVAYDKAFCFYYQENLDLLREAGAEIIGFSPLADSAIPDGADLVYIGGGYPELFASMLSANSAMLCSIKEWAESGRPLYAECGGLMYLSGGISDFNNKFFGMADIYPFKTRMKKERSRLGYREVMLKHDCLLGAAGTIIRGHEFHYSEIDGGEGEDSISLYSTSDSSGRLLQDEGWLYKQSIASYVHLHFASNPGVAANIIDTARGKKWNI